MKRCLFMTVLLLALGASSAWAETKHTVKEGECLSRIGRVYCVQWQEIQKANELKSETILPGQQLLIPDRNEKRVAQGSNVKASKLNIWKKVKANPYKGTAKWAIQNFSLPEEIKAQVLENIRQKKKSDWVEIGSGQMISQVTFGNNKIWTNVLTLWDSSKLYAAKDYGVGEYHVVQVLKCRNWAWWKEDNKPAQLPLISELKPIDLVTGGVSATKTEEKPECDSWDWYVGGGNYFSRVEGDDNYGRYAWSKLRVRPWCFKINEKTNISVGFFGFAAGGDGVAARCYKYGWKEAVLGLTTKITAEHKDFDIDLGAGKLSNRGKWEGKVVNKQTDDILLGSVHGNFYERRDAGEELLPKGEFNIEGRIPFDTNVKKGEKSDNQVVEAMLTQWLYDFEIGEDKSLVASPGWNLGGGYEWGSEHESFLKTGPAIEVSSYDNVVAGFSIYNFKFQGTGQWHPIGGYVSVDGMHSAWKAYNISEATAADLENLPANGESKLLYNPADYLK